MVFKFQIFLARLKKAKHTRMAAHTIPQTLQLPWQRGQNLGLLYQECLTAVVRVQTGIRSIDTAAFRQAATRSVREAEHNAKSLSYEQGEIQKASLAVVALLDEVALTSDAIDRAAWADLPLALDLYQEPRAGQAVFNQLEDCLRAQTGSQHSADLLEVYLLCLLLGLEGRYASRREGLHELIEKTRGRIEMIRGRSARLTPEADVPPPQSQASYPPPQSTHNPWIAIGAIFAAGTLVLFLFLKLHLWWEAAKVTQTLTGR